MLVKVLELGLVVLLSSPQAAQELFVVRDVVFDAQLLLLEEPSSSSPRVSWPLQIVRWPIVVDSPSPAKRAGCGSWGFSEARMVLVAQMAKLGAHEQVFYVR